MTKLLPQFFALTSRTHGRGRTLPRVASDAASSGQLERRHFILGLAAAGALVALPQPAAAAAPSYYGRGFQAGGYR